VTKEAPVKDQDDGQDCTPYLMRHLAAGPTLDDKHPYGEYGPTPGTAAPAGAFRGGEPWWTFDGTNPPPGAFRGGAPGGAFRGAPNPWGRR
jgi:hypothetical protein